MAWTARGYDKTRRPFWGVVVGRGVAWCEPARALHLRSRSLRRSLRPSNQRLRLTTSLLRKTMYCQCMPFRWSAATRTFSCRGLARSIGTGNSFLEALEHCHPNAVTHHTLDMSQQMWSENACQNIATHHQMISKSRSAWTVWPELPQRGKRAQSLRNQGWLEKTASMYYAHCITP